MSFTRPSDEGQDAASVAKGLAMLLDSGEKSGPDLCVSFSSIKETQKLRSPHPFD
jgi:hypothetical protein